MAEGTGTRIRELREALGLTQVGLFELATRAGCTLAQSAISQIETDQRQVTSRTLRALAEAFGLSADDLHAYLEGRTPLDEVLSRASAKEGAPQPAPRSAPRRPRAQRSEGAAASVSAAADAERDACLALLDAEAVRHPTDSEAGKALARVRARILGAASASIVHQGGQG